MQKYCLIFLMLAVIILPCGPLSAAEKPFLELIESVPVETTLDVPEVRNADQVWVEMMNSAKKSIDIEQFYFANVAGEPLEKVLNAIVDASARGVKIRIITDESFRKESISSYKLLSGKPGIQWKWINVFKEAGGIQHAKFFIIDGEELFTGSQNFDWRALKHISEIGVRVRHHDCVQVAADLFDLDWRLCDARSIEEAQSLIKKKNYRVPFTLTGSNGESIEFSPTCDPVGLIPDQALWEEPEIIKLINGAKKEVCLQVLTYSPVTREGGFYDALDSALRRAANRGVQVRIVVSSWNAKRPHIDLLKSLAVNPNQQPGEPSNVHLRVTTIPAWSKGSIPYARVQHSKYLIIDDRACWIGSSNWEKGYFYSCRNLGMVIKSPSMAGTLKKVFQKTWKSVYARPLDIYRNYPAGGEKT